MLSGVCGGKALGSGQIYVLEKGGNGGTAVRAAEYWRVKKLQIRFGSDKNLASVDFCAEPHTVPVSSRGVLITRGGQSWHDGFRRAS